MNESHNGPEPAADAAQAFEALQAEVSLQRRAVEALGDALEAHSPPDLSLDIARILKGQTQVVEQLALLHRHPALDMTPVQYGQAIARVGESLAHDTAHQLERAVQGVEREREQLARLVGSALRQKDQQRLLVWTATAALVAGLLLSPLLILALPMTASSHVAAFLLGGDRWDAGASLMRAADPDTWPEVVNAAHLVRDNKAAMAACREAALKTRREQRCTLVVAAPAS